MRFLCIDIGTTCQKAQVFDEKGNVLFSKNREGDLKEIDGNLYVDIADISEAMTAMVREAAGVGHIDSIAFSSLGESFVLLDREDRVLYNPMIYTDPRGKEEAREVSEKLGDERIYSIAGVMPDAMYSFYKLLWIKKHCPGVLAKADKFMQVGEYMGYLVSGLRAVDYALAARSGIFDLKKKTFSAEMTEPFGISTALFSKAQPTGTVIGKVSMEFAKKTGINPDCVLVAGSHDQICAAMGAGILDAGEAVDGMGTVECITSVFRGIPENADMGHFGYPVVPYPVEGLYCTYILNLTSGSIVKWFRDKLVHGYGGDKGNFFAYYDGSVEGAPSDVMMLPNFGATATPYRDPDGQGGFVNLTLTSTDTDMYRAILEGTGYEMRLNLDTVDKLGIRVRSLVAAGGGSRSLPWLQVKSDILGIGSRQLVNTEGGLCGLAVLQSVAMGAFGTFEEARAAYVKYGKEITPADTYKEAYDRKYDAYKKLYQALKSVRI